MTAPTPRRLVPATATGERRGLAKRIADRIESLTEFDGDMVAPMSRDGFRARIDEAIVQTIEAIDPLPSSPHAGRVSREDVERVERVARALARRSAYRQALWANLPAPTPAQADAVAERHWSSFRDYAEDAIAALGLEIEPAQEASDEPAR
jgi:hypothetical protein